MCGGEASAMTNLPPSARFAALLIALAGLGGLALQFSVSLEKNGTPLAALWAMSRFFTVIGNLVAALVLLAAALGLRAATRPHRLAGAALLTGLIGVVYAALLRRTEHLTGHAEIASILLHYAVPALVALFWLTLAPKGGLRRGDPFRWALLPLAYLPYALARAQADGRYPYPFLDAARLGWTQVMLNATLIAAAFVLAGLLLVWLDRRLAGSAPAREGPIRA
jgi:hypothetical protein